MSWKSLAGIAPRRTIRVLNTIHSFPEKVFIGLGSGRGQALSMANENKPRVAIVDDDPLIVESFATSSQRNSRYWNLPLRLRRRNRRCCGKWMS